MTLDRHAILKRGSRVYTRQLACIYSPKGGAKGGQRGGGGEGGQKGGQSVHTSQLACIYSPMGQLSLSPHVWRCIYQFGNTPTQTADKMKHDFLYTLPDCALLSKRESPATGSAVVNLRTSLPPPETPPASPQAPITQKWSTPSDTVPLHLRLRCIRCQSQRLGKLVQICQGACLLIEGRWGQLVDAITSSRSYKDVAIGLAGSQHMRARDRQALHQFMV